MIFPMYTMYMVKCNQDLFIDLNDNHNRISIKKYSWFRTKHYILDIKFILIWKCYVLGLGSDNF